MKRLIEVAIAEKRIVRFRYKGLNRIGEPHVLGKKNGKDQLLLFQLAGQTSTEGLPQWRRVNVDEISELEITKYGFDMKRHVNTGNPRGWDEFVVVAQG